MNIKLVYNYRYMVLLFILLYYTSAYTTIIEELESVIAIYYTALVVVAK